jgi:hypothetical protein
MIGSRALYQGTTSSLRENKAEQQVPPLRYAPVGMTILFGIGMSLPERLFGIECRYSNRIVIPTGA